MKRKYGLKLATAFMLSVMMLLSVMQPAFAAHTLYLPNVTEEMTNYQFWAELQEDSDEVILTLGEIAAYNQDIIDASGTMVMDIKGYADTFDGTARNEALKKSATADAEYYFGWTYDPKTGKIADWSYFQKMIDNCYDPKAKKDMPYRYGIVVNRTVLKAFPSDNPIWDDPADVDFDYQSLSGVRVNEPVLIYTTSKDGKYFMARTDDCSGWIAVQDVAICASKDAWLAAWDLPSEDLLVVYGNKVYTDSSIYAPETSRRLLTQGTALELVKDVAVDEVIINRHPYHNYVVYLPVREKDGSYSKQKALISQMAEVSVGYLPLTKRNIAMVAMENLGDTYGWGGMLDVEDCSGQVRTIYECFGLDIARNGNWQWKMNMEKIDMANMSLDEKCAILDELPLGAALCFPGHEMLYLGKYDGNYYVISTVGSIMSPETGNRLRVRGTIINTMDTKRANGQTWLQALNMAFMPCYATLEGKTYDFPEVQWYRDGVGYVLKNSLIANYANGYFGIDDAASRETAVNALWRMDGRPTVTATEVFGDVSAEKHAISAISWANANGIVGGYGNKAFGPEDEITREQIVTMFWRYAKYLGYDVSVGEDTNILSYCDAFDISAYSIPAVQWACGAGVLIGEKTDCGMALQPQSSATRAQLSVMLMRFNNWLKQAKYAPHVFDLTQGDLMLSAGDKEYSDYLATTPAPEKAPAPAYASQDGGETWIKLKGSIIVVTSAPTENTIYLDVDAPYGEITLTLDGVHTSSDLLFAAQGDATIHIKGDVNTGTITSGKGYGLKICGAEDSQTNTLTVNASEQYGIIASGDIYIADLTNLNVSAGKDGLYTERGSIMLEDVASTITAGEDFSALKIEEADARITINGTVLTEVVGASIVIGD